MIHTMPHKAQSRYFASAVHQIRVKPATSDARIQMKLYETPFFKSNISVFAYHSEHGERSATEADCTAPGMDVRHHRSRSTSTVASVQEQAQGNRSVRASTNVTLDSSLFNLSDARCAARVTAYALWWSLMRSAVARYFSFHTCAHMSANVSASIQAPRVARPSR
jgi:hypothetical protein